MFQDCINFIKGDEEEREKELDKISDKGEGKPEEAKQEEDLGLQCRVLGGRDQSLLVPEKEVMTKERRPRPGLWDAAACVFIQRIPAGPAGPRWPCR